MKSGVATAVSVHALPIQKDKTPCLYHCLIDDARRFIAGIDVFYNDNFVNLMSVMRSTVAKYGRLKVFNLIIGNLIKPNK